MGKSKWNSRDLRVAIIGSGPSGFFAADALLNLDISVQVDLFEYLPIPYGLIRYGIAPDHPRTKSVINKFNMLGESNKFRFIGNINIGTDISYNELQSFYDVIVFSYGAGIPKKLGIPNEGLNGVHTAIKFVRWYNGHPDFVDAEFALNHENAAIIGNGNVALDAARILAKNVDELRDTDIAQHALDALATSAIKNIHIIGRRGPLQTSFSFKDLKELSELSGCTMVINPKDLELNQACQEELENTQSTYKKFNYRLFENASKNSISKSGRNIIFHFLKSPIMCHGHDRIDKVILEKNVLDGLSESQHAIGTGDKEELKCGILFSSIGYRGSKIANVPFDERRGVIANIDGRVVDDGKTLYGVYAIGWIQRGSNGLLGTNKRDSTRFVKCLLDDLEKINPCKQPNNDGIFDLINRRGVKTTRFSDWLTIDRIEIERGVEKNKPREKLVNLTDIFNCID